METGTLISVAEYLSTSYRPDCEYLDGVVLERNLGEWDHSRLQYRLAVEISAQEKRLGMRGVVEQRVQVRPNRFRVPDVCVVLDSAPTEQILRRPPFLCIEILSKDDRMSEMQERIDDYLAFGSPYVWVIDPRTKRAFIYTSEGMREVRDGVLRTADPEIVAPLAALFE
jgi:Uma2 family endonuclease